jgi:hypothetical protein
MPQELDDVADLFPWDGHHAGDVTDDQSPSAEPAHMTGTFLSRLM